MRLLDDDTYLDTYPSHLIGEIKLVINRTTNPIKKIEQRNTFEPLHSQKVHERSKKGIAHRVKWVASLTYNI
jgi:hypothetical protein